MWIEAPLAVVSGINPSPKRSSSRWAGRSRMRGDAVRVCHSAIFVSTAPLFCLSCLLCDWVSECVCEECVCLCILIVHISQVLRRKSSIALRKEERKKKNSTPTFSSSTVFLAPSVCVVENYLTTRSRRNLCFLHLFGLHSTLDSSGNCISNDCLFCWCSWPIKIFLNSYETQLLPFN